MKQRSSYSKATWLRKGRARTWTWFIWLQSPCPWIWWHSSFLNAAFFSKGLLETNTLNLKANLLWGKFVYCGGPAGKGCVFWGASQVVLVVKSTPASAGRHKRHRFDPWVGKIPWMRTWQPPPIFLPEESMDRGAWRAAVHRVAHVGHNWSDLACTHVFFERQQAFGPSKLLSNEAGVYSACM